MNSYIIEPMKFSSPSRFHYGYLVLATGVLTTFAAIGLGRFAMGMIINSMGEGLGLDSTQQGIIVSGNFFGYFLSTVASGALASKFGPRQVIALSLVLVAVGMVMAGSAIGFITALVAQVLIGIGSGGSNIPVMGLISRWYANRVRGSAAGIMMIGSGSGFASAGILVPFLMSLYDDSGWRMSWYVLAAAVAGIAILGALIFRNSPARMGLEPVGGLDGLDDNKDEPVNLREMYFSGALIRLGIIYLMFGFSYVIFTTFFASYLVEQAGFSNALAGKVWMAIGLVSISSGFIWGVVSDRLGRRRALAIVYAMQAMFLVIFATTQVPAVIITVAVLYGATIWGIPAIMSAACADYVGGRLAPAALGMITIFFSIGQVASPWISGYMIDITGSYVTSFLASATAGVLGAMLVMILPRSD